MSCLDPSNCPSREGTKGWKDFVSLLVFKNKDEQ
jgi:hypothetical protein